MRQDTLKRFVAGMIAPFFRLGRADEAIDKGQSGVVSVYRGETGLEEDTGEDITAYSRFGDVVESAFVICIWFFGWHVLIAECEATPEPTIVGFEVGDFTWTATFTGRVQVKLWGAGAGGNSDGRGGGGGAFAEEFFDVVEGVDYDGHRGAKGLADADGEDSWFKAVDESLAKAGKFTGEGGQADQCVGRRKYSGGDGGIGGLNGMDFFGGGGGSGAGSAAAGLDGQDGEDGGTGGVGPTGGGDGGRGWNTTPATDGQTPAGGGGGGDGAANAGDGNDGVVILRFVEG